MLWSTAFRSPRAPSPRTGWAHWSAPPPPSRKLSERARDDHYSGKHGVILWFTTQYTATILWLPNYLSPKAPSPRIRQARWSAPAPQSGEKLSERGGAINTTQRWRLQFPNTCLPLGQNEGKRRQIYYHQRIYIQVRWWLSNSPCIPTCERHHQSTQMGHTTFEGSTTQ